MSIVAQKKPEKKVSTGERWKRLRIETELAFRTSQGKLKKYKGLHGGGMHFLVQFGLTTFNLTLL